MHNLRDAFRRWLEMLCLSLGAGMLFWGHIVLRPHLRGWGFICYWTGCFLFSLVSTLLALQDLVVIYRRTRQQQAQLRRRGLDEVRRNSVHHGGTGARERD